jgi:hypothetical protein
MTVSSSTNSVSYIGNGAQIEYAFPFRVLEEEHLIVTLDGVVTTEWSGIGYGDDNGGSIFFNVAPADGVEIVIYRSVPIFQEIDYVPYDPFPAETHELGLDIGIMIDQQLQEQVTRALKVPPGSNEELILDLPPSGQRGFSVLHFDETGLVVRADYEIGNYIGYWATATGYRARATFSDPATENLFVVLKDHTSTDLVSDEANGDIKMIMDFATVVQKRDEAVQAANNAAVSEANAAASEAAAATSEANAATSEENAYSWAQEDKNVPVDDGVHPSGFSAYHWSKVAEDFINAGGAVAVTRTIPNSTGNVVDDINAFDFTGDPYADDIVTTALEVLENMSLQFVYDGIAHVYQGMKPDIVGLGAPPITAADLAILSSASASATSYDPSGSYLTDNNVQDAIDTLAGDVDTNKGDIATLNTDVTTLQDQAGRWAAYNIGANQELIRSEVSPQLWKITADGLVMTLPGDATATKGYVFSFYTTNAAGISMTFDDDTNGQTILVPDEKTEAWRGSNSIISITYVGNNQWLLYGDLADA